MTKVKGTLTWLPVDCWVWGAELGDDGAGSIQSIIQYLWDTSRYLMSLYLCFLFCENRGVTWMLGTAASRQPCL